MSTPFQFQNPQPVFQPLPPRPTKHTGLKVGAGILGGIMLLGVGSALGKSPAAAPAPATTVSATVTTTATVTKASVPAVCLAALDDADGLVVVFQATVGIFVDILDAVGRYDAKAVNAGADKIAVQTAKVKANPYATDSAACRAAARS